jgi:hypothetical protein
VEEVVSSNLTVPTIFSISFPFNGFQKTADATAQARAFVRTVFPPPPQFTSLFSSGGDKRWSTPSMTDRELLRRFVDQRDQDAFADLVRRHIGPVHARARRQTDEALAGDVTQTVFLLLARKAPSLPENVVLSAWWFRATSFVVAQARRSQARRARREKEAASMMMADANAFAICGSAGSCAPRTLCRRRVGTTRAPVSAGA